MAGRKAVRRNTNKRHGRCAGGDRRRLALELLERRCLLAAILGIELYADPTSESGLVDATWTSLWTSIRRRTIGV